MNKFFQELKFGSTTTYVLLGINVLFFLIALFIKLTVGYNAVEIADFLGGSSIYHIFDGQLWRLVTANFIQEDIFHFGFNALALYYYGGFIERFYSGRKMFVVYILCGISGTTLSLLNLDSITFGASASIWGFLGLMVGNSMRKNRYSPGLPIDTRQMIPSIVLWLLIGFGMPGISGLGHLGGFIGGVVLGIFIETANSFSSEGWSERVFQTFFYTTLLITFASLLMVPISWVM